LKREEKSELVRELNAKFANAKLAVLSDYRGLTVGSLEELRGKLRAGSAEFKVAKNTLLRLAIRGTSFEPLDNQLSGNTAFTLAADDPVAPVKVLVDFAESTPKLVIKSAVLGGKLLSAADLSDLSKLPGINELRAQLLSLMLAVPTGLVRALGGVGLKTVCLLQAIKNQREQTN